MCNDVLLKGITHNIILDKILLYSYATEKLSESLIIFSVIEKIYKKGILIH